MLRHSKICEILSCIRVRDSDPLGRRYSAVARVAWAHWVRTGRLANIARPGPSAGSGNLGRGTPNLRRRKRIWKNQQLSIFPSLTKKC